MRYITQYRDTKNRNKYTEQGAKLKYGDDEDERYRTNDMEVVETDSGCADRPTQIRCKLVNTEPCKPKIGHRNKFRPKNPPEDNKPEKQNKNYHNAVEIHMFRFY